MHFLKVCAALCCAALLIPLGGCAAKTADNSRVQIVATLFPQYDFARELAGEYADVTLLLPPGVESHSFEPTPADMLRIADADLFLYTGEYMEPWAQTILDGIESDVRPVDMSMGITLEVEGEHAHETHEEHAAHGGFDPHIWTDPHNAMTMVGTLTDALCEADPAHTEQFRANEAVYLQKLDALDQTFADIVEAADRREIVFGGRFALHYFAERYGISYHAAFDSCSHESEPSVRILAELIDEIKTEKIPVIYHEELTEPKVARAIGEETGAKLLLLHSCHNVSREEQQAGVSYLSLMEQNARNLKEGLNGWR